MQKVEYQNNASNKIKKIYTKKHQDTIQDLEKLLEKGVPDLTMSEIASKLKKKHQVLVWILIILKKKNI